MKLVQYLKDLFLSEEEICEKICKENKELFNKPQPTHVQAVAEVNLSRLAELTKSLRHNYRGRYD